MLSDFIKTYTHQICKVISRFLSWWQVSWIFMSNWSSLFNVSPLIITSFSYVFRCSTDIQGMVEFYTLEIYVLSRNWHSSSGVFVTHIPYTPSQGCFPLMLCLLIQYLFDLRLVLQEYRIRYFERVNYRLLRHVHERVLVVLHDSIYGCETMLGGSLWINQWLLALLIEYEHQMIGVIVHHF